MRLENEKFLVLGFARSGQAAARALLAEHAQVAACDRRTIAELGSDAADLAAAGVKLYVGSEEPVVADMGLRALILSPAVSLENAMVQVARQAGIPIISELELAFLLKPPLVDIYAVTGTNGKTTTTSLLEYILQAAGIKALSGGNIGVPLSSLWDSLTDGVAVAEASSFQLETAVTFQPHIAVILNITSDHLDRHHDMENYINCKANIFQAQQADDFLILNYDDVVVRPLAQRAASQVLFFSASQVLEDGIYIQDGMIKIKHKQDYIEVLELKDLLIRGRHNWENALAATAAAYAAGVEPAVMRSALSSFAGVRHRIEEAGRVAGVLYVNDSKGTNPVSTINALRAFSEPVLLIAGGRDKESDFSELAQLIKAKVKYLLLLGEARAKIAAIMHAVGFPEEHIVIVDTMAEAVKCASHLSQPGEVVLLSPACASWDMYNSFEERGDEFCMLVKRLSDSKWGA